MIKLCKKYGETLSCCTSISVSEQCKPCRSPKNYFRTTISDYTYDNMIKQVKAVCSESKREQSEEEIKVEDESCELEETFFSNMKSNERDNCRGKGRVRGLYRDKYKDNDRKKAEKQKSTHR